MIIYKKGDLLEAPEKYIMHGCNNRAVMASGVALCIKTKWPKAYEDYLEYFRLYGESDPYVEPSYFLGRQCHSEQPDGKIIINAITQEGYGRDGSKFVSYDAIDVIFKALNQLDIKEVAIPKIGAGLGGGDWSVIESIIKHRAVNYDVVVYEL